MTKNITKTLSVLRGEDNIVKELRRDLPDDVLVAYASVQITDSVGDIVEIKGISWDDYHNPPNTYMKILGGHIVTTPDGSPPVVGRVERLLPVTKDIDGEPTPALAFAMSWAKDGEGNITELAQKFKSLYDGGYLDSFSVGMLVDDAEPIKGTGGLKFTKTRLYEISAVSVPACSQANVLRAMDVLGRSFDVHRVLVEQLGGLQQLVGSLAEQVKDLASRNTPREVIEALSVVEKSLAQKLDSQEARLDSIEASIVVQSEKRIPKTDDRKTESLQAVEDLRRTISRFAGR